MFRDHLRLKTREERIEDTSKAIEVDEHEEAHVEIDDSVVDEKGSTGGECDEYSDEVGVSM